MNKYIFITIIILIFTILLFEFTNIDILVQNWFYNFETKEWILNRNEPILKFIFYNGIKKLLIIIALTILLTLILFRKKIFIIEYKKGLIIVLLSSIFVPITIGSLKKMTNMPCPKNIQIYNGIYPKIKLFEKYPNKFNKPKIECWPAGHASGGFALLSLFFLFKSRKNRILALTFALSIGFSMGIYKMLIGDHFLSHTLITMILAWLITLIIVNLSKSKIEILTNRVNYPHLSKLYETSLQGGGFLTNQL